MTKLTVAQCYKGQAFKNARNDGAGFVDAIARARAANAFQRCAIETVKKAQAAA